ncbi:MAG: hypothetical protein R2769_12700 [Saprospiraceae bacterium]
MQRISESGQYQHDVNQTLLKDSLDRTVESAVNAVGIEFEYCNSFCTNLCIRFRTPSLHNPSFNSEQKTVLFNPEIN